jgi:hypothetical protein
LEVVDSAQPQLAVVVEAPVIQTLQNQKAQTVQVVQRQAAAAPAIQTLQSQTVPVPAVPFVLETAAPYLQNRHFQNYPQEIHQKKEHFHSSSHHPPNQKSPNFHCHWNPVSLEQAQQQAPQNLAVAEPAQSFQSPLVQEEAPPDAAAPASPHKQAADSELPVPLHLPKKCHYLRHQPQMDYPFHDEQPQRQAQLPSLELHLPSNFPSPQQDPVFLRLVVVVVVVVQQPQAKPWVHLS